VVALPLTKTARDLAAAIIPEKSPTDLLVAYRKIMPSLSFYTRGRVVQVQAYGELDFGAEQSTDQAEFFWDDTHRLESEWRSSRRVFIATNRDLEETLAARLDPRPKVLARDGNRVVLVNFAPLRSAAGDVGRQDLASPSG
jgi:Aminoarabinose transferase C-terminal domain